MKDNFIATTMREYLNEQKYYDEDDEEYYDLVEVDLSNAANDSAKRLYLYGVLAFVMPCFFERWKIIYRKVYFYSVVNTESCMFVIVL